MRRLIINADDLGMSVEVNYKIEQCILRGCITSSTLISNAPAFEEGIRIAKQYPQISVGVHLNLVEFKPLTNEVIFRKHGIVGDDGCFIEEAIFYVPINEELQQAIFEEWDAQIGKIEKAGISPTHCDSHEHTHTIKQLQDVLCRVMDKHNIHRVRRKDIPSIPLMLQEKKHPTEVKLDKSKAYQPKKRNVIYRRFHLFYVILSNWHWNRQMSKRYSMSDKFYAFRYFYLNRRILHLGNQESVIELMCHPGNKPFQSETEELMRDMSWFEHGYTLIPYHQL